jgi:hypothetical protein
MNQYYIIENGGLHTFPTKEALIKYLEVPLKRKFNMTKAQWVEHITSLGHNVTDDYSFYQTLSEHFEMGVIRSDNHRMRCDIFYAAKPSEAHGD